MSAGEELKGGGRFLTMGPDLFGQQLEGANKVLHRCVPDEGDDEAQEILIHDPRRVTFQIPEGIAPPEELRRRRIDGGPTGTPIVPAT